MATRLSRLLFDSLPGRLAPCETGGRNFYLLLLTRMLLPRWKHDRKSRATYGMGWRRRYFILAYGMLAYYDKKVRNLGVSSELSWHVI